jgi:hypothetical protein
MRPAPARHPVVLVVAGVVLVGSGLAIALATPRADAPEIGTPVAAASSTAPPSTAPAPTTAPQAPASPPAPAPVAPAPVEIRLPVIADPVPLVPVGVLDSGALQLPARPSVLGWFAAGAVPGDATGTAVIAGHVDSAEYGPGPLETLFELREGDLLEVMDGRGGTHRYGVVSRTSYPKSALPPEVFRLDGPAQLALVTCGGAFDEATGEYADNVVVLAAPVTTGDS